jgi:hypothetical protein
VALVGPATSRVAAGAVVPTPTLPGDGWIVSGDVVCPKALLIGSAMLSAATSAHVIGKRTGLHANRFEAWELVTDVLKIVMSSLH